MPSDLSRAEVEIAERQRAEEQRLREEDERLRAKIEWQRAKEERLRADEQRRAEERRRKEEERELAERKARDVQSALEALARERTQLLHAASAVEPVANREDWQTWRDRAEAAMAEAGMVGEDAALVEDTRKALAASAEALARGLAVDREAAELYRDWDEYFVQLGRVGIHPFHAPGSAALAGRTVALEKRVVQPLEMPGLLRMGLEDSGAASFPRPPPQLRGTFQKGERVEHGEVASRQALVHRPDAAVEERHPVVQRSLLLLGQHQHCGLDALLSQPISPCIEAWPLGVVATGVAGAVILSKMQQPARFVECCIRVENIEVNTVQTGLDPAPDISNLVVYEYDRRGG